MKQPYGGYLRQHLELIERMHCAGERPKTIAKHLYELGARAQSSSYDKILGQDAQIINLANLVSFILRKHFNYRQPKPLHFWEDQI